MNPDTLTHSLSVLNLNAPALKHWMFKSGENQVRLTEPIEGHVKIDFRYSGDASLFKLSHAVDCIRRNGVKNLSLFCPYFPGARQDRACYEGDSLGVKVYADFINSLRFDDVEVFDAHSDVVGAVVNNCRVRPNHGFVVSSLERAGLRWGAFNLVSPDAGANKKVFSLASYLRTKEFGVTVVRADKKRNPENGEIEGTQVFADSLLGSTCVIVDDIISGGRTFTSLATELHRLGASSVLLIVSHHEGIADERTLRESHIHGVYTTDSLPLACLNASDFTHILPLIP